MTFSELDNQYVWLELQTKNNKSATGGNWASNRIALKCETITINTSKQVISHAIPGSGVIYGESRTAALDLGMTDKTLSINGIITEQTIVKNFEDSETTNDVSKYLTAHEVSQLIHSYVDSSFAQSNQNPNRLLILIPSRVGEDWDYHAGITETTLVENCPLIPFTYKARSKDNKQFLFSSKPGTFPEKVTSATDSVTTALKGFVRNFSTTMQAGQPYMEFSLDFQIADVSF